MTALLLLSDTEVNALGVSATATRDADPAA
jgi:hypothetical protein